MTQTGRIELSGQPRVVTDDEFRLLVGRGGGSGRAASGALGGRLSKLLSGRRVGVSAGVAPRSPASPGFGGDGRQRVIVKVAFVNHGRGGGGAGGKLVAHGRYLERDGAGREGERGQFYDRDHDVAQNARERLHDWDREDPRHFRIMLAPESGARIVDLREFTRESMQRMERDLGLKLDWVAVDHHNTDNPHTHVILRGVREDGLDLMIPREYMTHGLRHAAREAATELIGERGPEDERLARSREIEARGFTRLDRELDHALGEKREVLLQALGKGRDPGLGPALRARARELERMGLAPRCGAMCWRSTQIGRNVWRRARRSTSSGNSRARGSMSRARAASLAKWWNWVHAASMPIARSSCWKSPMAAACW